MILLCGTSQLRAQQGLTLESSIAIALENNLNVKIAKNQAEIADNNATKGNAGLLPVLSANGASNYSEHSANEVSSSASVNVSYNLFNELKARYNYKILNLRKEQGELNARFSIENIITNVVSEFYQLSKSYDDLSVVIENMEISRDRLNRNQSKYEFGNITKLEVLNAKVDFNRDSSNYLQTKQIYQETVREMNILLGRKADTEIQVVPDKSDFRLLDLEELKSHALKENAEYLIKESEFKENEFVLKQSKAAQLPSISFNSAYSYADQKVMGTNSHTQLTGGLNMSFTIFDGKQKKRNIVNAKIEKQNAELEYENKLLELEKDLLNAYTDYQFNLRILHLEEDALEAARLNFDQTKAYYQLGQVSATTFRNAQLNWMEAKNNKAAARYNAKLSEINMLKLSGSLLKPFKN